MTIDEQLSALKRIAGEEVELKVLDQTVTVYGSELATLRLYKFHARHVPCDQGACTKGFYFRRNLDS